MAGITAVAASADVTSGESAADNSASGFITAEQIVLATSPAAATSYSWGLAIPQGSSAGRSALSSTTDAAPVFTPDVAGTYVITCTVDSSTSYVLRLTVTALAVAVPTQAIRFSPVTDSSVIAPALGAMLYYSSDQDALVTKLPDDSVSRSYVLRFADVVVSAFTIDQTYQTTVSVPGLTADQNALGTIRQQSAGAPLVLLNCRADENEVVLVFGVTGSINWVGGTADLAVQILPAAAS
jgi:hypothetical protein